VPAATTSTTPARRDLPLLLTGAAVSTAGTSITLIAVALHVQPYGPKWVAGVMAAQVLPSIAVAPFAGDLVDRVANRRLLVAALLVEALAVCAAAWFGMGEHGVWPLLPAMAALGAAGTVAGTTVAALLPRISGEDGATRAYGWYASITQAGFLGGFAVSGVLVELVGTRRALLVDAASFGLMAIAGARVRADRHPRREAAEGAQASPGEETGGGRAGLMIGFTRLRDDRLLRVAVGGLGVAVLASIVVNVAEVFFVTQDLRAGPATYGLVTACWPLAGIAGGWAAGRLTGERALTNALAVGAVGMGLGLLLAGAVVSLVTLVIGWLVGGAANAVQRVAITALVRVRTPDAARGRVFAAVAASLQTFNVVGLLVSGVVVAAVGARASMVGAGLVTVAVGVGTWLLTRSASQRTAGGAPSGSVA